jgi:predicted type IV restriction endonuclease
MAFEEDLARHVDQIKVRLPHIRGEEATKHSLVVPLFQVLGYDVWNPLEVQPEYGADFNKAPKKGQVEKVDYALKIKPSTWSSTLTMASSRATSTRRRPFGSRS